MMRILILLGAIALSVPAAAQHHDTQQASSPAPVQSAVAPACTHEHAAMGHCTLPVAAPLQNSGDAKCTPEHAAMGHCTLPATTPRPPSRDAKCSAEHAAMGHCTLPVAAPQQPSGDAKCTPEHAAMGHCALAGKAMKQSSDGASTPTAIPQQPPPPVAYEGPEHAADAVWGNQAMAPVRRAVYAEHGRFRGSRILLDRLEYQARDGHDGYAWEGDAWYGGDYDRLWFKSEGEGGFGGALEEAEAQLLWSRALGPWFNLQTGVRYDIRPRSQRTHLAVGVQGLAPYWFEIDAAVFLSDRGDLTARIEGEYDQRITNQLILQPRIEATLSAQDVPDIAIGSGLSAIEAGLRLRYEIVPEFAPYVGVQYERSIGDTAVFARAAGERRSDWALVAGLRMWF